MTERVIHLKWELLQRRFMRVMVLRYWHFAGLIREHPALEKLYHSYINPSVVDQVSAYAQQNDSIASGAGLAGRIEKLCRVPARSGSGAQQLPVTGGTWWGLRAPRHDPVIGQVCLHGRQQRAWMAYP